jgi:hypothetical protein
MNSFRGCDDICDDSRYEVLRPGMMLSLLRIVFLWFWKHGESIEGARGEKDY